MMNLKLTDVEEQHTMTEVNLEILSDEQMDDLAAAMPLVKSWVSAIEIELRNRLEQGRQFQNASLVPSRAIRKWRDLSIIIPTLQDFADLDVVAPRVPLSPAQAEKKLGRPLYQRELSKHVVQESSGASLVYRNLDD